jgi:ParB/RepB/Spo0J family partition protein
VTTFKQIPLVAIYHSPYNPRRKPTADDPKVKELAASIKAVGLIQPISIRHTGVKGDYEIIAGARRFEAAKLAGLNEIAAMVHQISEDDALKITVTENLQREDLTPLEEGRGIASLLQAGRSTEEIAADIAKSPTWVRRRAKLAELSQEWQYAVTDGDLQYFGAAHLELVAHLSPMIQKKLLGALKSKRKEADGTITLSTLKYAIHDYTHYLSEASFDSKAFCAACPNRSDREPDLFAGVNACYGGERQEKAQCLDSECWKAKTEAFIDAGKKAIFQKTGKEPVLINSGYGPAPKGSISSWQVKEAKPKDKGAVPAMAIAGEKAGKLIYIIPPESNPRAAAKDSKPKVATPKQRRLQHMINGFNDWLGDQNQCPPSLLQSPYHMLAFIRTYGTDGMQYDAVTPKEFDAMTAAKYSVKLMDDIWGVSASQMGINVRGPEWIEQRDEDALVLALHICGLDMQDFIDKAEQAINPPLTETLTKTTKKGAKK